MIIIVAGLAVPTLFAYMLNNDDVPPLRKDRLRFARSASAPLPPETHRKFESRFGVPIVEQWWQKRVRKSYQTRRLRADWLPRHWFWQ